MLEIKQGKEDKKAIFENGIEVEGTFVVDNDKNTINVKDFEASQKLSDFRIEDFPETYEINFIDYKLLDESVSIDINIAFHSNEPVEPDYIEYADFTKAEVNVYIIPHQRTWKKIYSVQEYRSLVSSQLKTLNDFNVHIFVDDDGKILDVEYFSKVILKLLLGLPIILEFNEDFSRRKISEVVEPYIIQIEEVHQDCVVNILSTYEQNSVNTAFKFPEKIKTSCEQYLLYFAQFLQDLGITATSNLKEEAGRVLFSVTPTDDIEALDKIREALAVYLSLPTSPVLYNDSFQSMQLKQQVVNLQHAQRMKEMEMRSAQYALRLAQQNIENQDKIITRQNSFIDNQNKVIEKITSKSIMIDSLENKEELEKFCEGFEIGKSEFLIKHFGLHLNPATVLKNVGKKILGKEEERISILDSDEEADKK